MNSKHTEFLKHCFISIILFFVVNILIAGISAFLIQNETINKSLETYIIPVVLLVSSLTSSIHMSSVEKEKILIKSVILSAASVLIILLISTIFISGRLSVRVENVISIILGHIAVPIVHNKKNMGLNKGKHKYKYG